MALPILRRGGNPIPVRRGDTQESAPSRWEPWNDFEQMNRLFDSFFRTPFSLWSPSPRSAGASEPTVEMYETPDHLIVYLYAPGMASDSFDISASAEAVTIKGERRPLLEATEGVSSHTPW